MPYNQDISRNHHYPDTFFYIELPKVWSSTGSGLEDGEGEELGLGEGLGSGFGLQAVQTDEQQDVALE